MNNVENADIQKIRKEVMAIQENARSVLASLDALLLQDDADATAAVSVLSDKDTALQRDIIERGRGWSAYCFAKDVPGADIQELQRTVIECGNGWLAYRFAKDIKGADIQALQQAVIDRGGGDSVYYFARDIHGADIAALHARLLEMHSTGEDGEYLKEFNNDTAIQAILKEQQESADVSPLSAENAELQREIISKGDAMAACEFAKYIDGAAINALQQVVLDSGNTRAAYTFARDVKGADIDALQQVILDNGDGEDAYYFALYAKGSDVAALQDVVISSGDALHTYAFDRDVTGADLSSLHSRLVELRSMGEDSGYLDKFNNDPDIQAELKAQRAVIQHKPAGRNKRNPS